MKQSVAIIGGGPSALFLAAFIDTTKYDVTIYEKNKTLGRKFLVAGKGGFNLTHSEPIDNFINRYSPSIFLKESLLNFTNIDLCNWLSENEIPTFIGTSNRVYPEKGIKPIEVLNKIVSIIKKNGVLIKPEYEWKGWTTSNNLLFNKGNIVKADKVVFALGGGSWKVTGSDGSWLDLFINKGIKTKEFYPSNCSYRVNWHSNFISKNEGNPLKNIAISHKDLVKKGEVVVTKLGLEGNAIYALSPQIRADLKAFGRSTIHLDLKPMLSREKVLEKLSSSSIKNISKLLVKNLKLSKVQIGLLKEYLTKEEYLNPEILALRIKQFPLEITGTASLDEAISSVGGIDLDEVNKLFELNKIPNNYCIGEMLDWDAPTGGYLLQACFSMGVYLARNLNNYSINE